MSNFDLAILITGISMILAFEIKEFLKDIKNRRIKKQEEKDAKLQSG